MFEKDVFVLWYVCPGKKIQPDNQALKKTAIAQK